MSVSTPQRLTGLQPGGLGCGRGRGLDRTLRGHFRGACAGDLGLGEAVFMVVSLNGGLNGEIPVELGIMMGL